MPLGSFRESSSLATVPKFAKRPSTRGTSRTRPSPCRAAATAACASSRSSGIVTTMLGRTTPLLRGSSGMKSVLTSAIDNFSFVFWPGTTGETLGLCPNWCRPNGPSTQGSALGRSGIGGTVGPDQGADDLVEGGRDHLWRSGPIDEPELPLLAVIVDQRRGLLEEDVDPVVGDVGAIVLAVALAQPVQQRLPVGLQVEDRIQRTLELAEHSVQGLRLRHRPGKPVQDKAGFGVGLGEAVPDDVDDQLVRDELASVEVGAYPLAQRRPGLDLRPKNVARGNRRNAVLFRQPGCLRAFARSGRPEQDEVQGHGYLQGKPMGSA